jgi:hypothetical protein
MSKVRPTPHSKTVDLIRYFVEKQSGRIGRTKLAWLIYLADIEARRYLGRPISDLRFKLSLRGPFDPTLNRCVDRLKEADEITERDVGRPQGVASVLHVVAPLRPHPFTSGEECLLAFVVTSFGDMEPPEILFDAVHNSLPMQRVLDSPVGTPLPMECVDNQGRIELGGLDLERVLLAEEQARRGELISLEEVEQQMSAPNKSKRRKRGA